MADRRVDELTNLGAQPASGDLLLVVDVSSTALNAQGDPVKVTFSDAFSAFATDSDLTTHESDTTSVHGITDTSTILLKTLVDAKGDLVTASAADTPARLAVGSNGQVLKAASGESTGLQWAGQSEVIIIAVGDETTAITTGTAKVTFRMPFAMTLTAVRSSLTTASSSGLPTVDINEAGASILSTTLTIDANELTSTTAATAAVISDTALADDAEITIDIDTAGTGAKGLKVALIGTRA